MSSAQQGTTFVLAGVAVCLLVYVVQQELRGPRDYPRVAGAVGAVRNALGASKGVDCAKIKPGNPNWARCAQGSAIGRVPTQKASSVVKNSTIDFTKDSLQNQGLGAGRLQDDFVHQQFDTSLGLGGMRIDRSNLKNNAFFSQGTENPTHLVTSGISADSAAAFPFSRKSDYEAGEAAVISRTNSGKVPGAEPAPVGSGMSLVALRRQPKRSVVARDADGGGRGPSRAQVEKKLGVAPFDENGAVANPFLGGSYGSSAGLALTDAYDPPALGAGLSLTKAFQSNARSLGAAVSPVKSAVGVSPVEISEATAVLDNVNIVQSTTGGNLNIGIRP
ncbi:unnamed protein product [Pylaiella littoralis]